MNATNPSRRMRLVTLSVLAGVLVTAGCGSRASYEDRQAARYGVRKSAPARILLGMKVQLALSTQEEAIQIAA